MTTRNKIGIAVLASPFVVGFGFLWVFARMEAAILTGLFAIFGLGIYLMET